MKMRFGTGRHQYRSCRLASTGASLSGDETNLWLCVKELLGNKEIELSMTEEEARNLVARIRERLAFIDEQRGELRCPRCGSSEVRVVTRFGRDMGEHWCTGCGRRWDNDIAVGADEHCGGYDDDTDDGCGTDFDGSAP